MFLKRAMCRREEEEEEEEFFNHYKNDLKRHAHTLRRRRRRGRAFNQSILLSRKMTQTLTGAYGLSSGCM
jgi:hypothetical protein